MPAGVAFETEECCFNHLSATDSVIIGLSCLAAFFDFRDRRIPNWLICVGLVLAIALNATNGIGQILSRLAGFVLGIGILFLPFALGWIGAGDVKYFAVVGALLGVGWLPRVFFYSALSAGLITVGYLLVGAVKTVTIREQWSDVKLAILSMGHILPEPVSVRSRSGRGSVPWGVAFAAGTILAYYFDPNGSFAGF